MSKGEPNQLFIIRKTTASLALLQTVKTIWKRDSKQVNSNSSATGWRAARWQSGCIFRLYGSSTVWPASQCNPQTIPCCYSIARTAVMVPPLLLTLVIFFGVCALFILQASSPNHVFTDLLPITYLPKDVQMIISIFCRFKSSCPLLKQARRLTTWNTHKKGQCSLM